MQIWIFTMNYVFNYNIKLGLDLFYFQNKKGHLDVTDLFYGLKLLIYFFTYIDRSLCRFISPKLSLHWKKNCFFHYSLFPGFSSCVVVIVSCWFLCFFLWIIKRFIWSSTTFHNCFIKFRKQKWPIKLKNDPVFLM
jgi:hypothetical protein